MVHDPTWTRDQKQWYLVRLRSQGAWIATYTRLEKWDANRYEVRGPYASHNAALAALAADEDQ